jgi:hypothetical protein
VVSVHEIGTYDPDAGTGALGDLICQFSYGGLGRLTRKLSPFPGYAEYRTEHYYYDGVRRIQESWSDPIQSYSPFSSDDESGMSPVTWTEREYIHGPGYVDEYICQIDGFGRLAYILQDANYNVIAQANDDGEVIEQLMWSPYGELLARDSYEVFGLNKVGHQGLIFDRFDVPVTQSGLALQTSGAPPDGLFNSRNRSYSAKFGRFVQADPNGTATVLLSVLAMQGELADPQLSHLAMDTMYMDGMNRYAFARWAPTGNLDPLGLTTIGEVGAVQALVANLAAAFLTGAQSALVAAGSTEALVAGGLAGGAMATYLLLDIFAVQDTSFPSDKSSGLQRDWVRGRAQDLVAEGWSVDWIRKTVSGQITSKLNPKKGKRHPRPVPIHEDMMEHLEQVLKQMKVVP